MPLLHEFQGIPLVLSLFVCQTPQFSQIGLLLVVTGTVPHSLIMMILLFVDASQYSKFALLGKSVVLA